MLSRALSLAAVTLLIGVFAVPSAWAQAQNLEAGKSPSQLFAGTCNACHRSPRGLLKTVSAGSLPGFLRQHYTTGSDMAAQLSAFLISNGAGDTRAKQGVDAKTGSGSDQVDRQGRKLRPAGSQEATRPEAEPSPQAGRNARRQAQPGEVPDSAKPAADRQGPAQTTTERGPDGRGLTAKQRLSKRGKPGAEENPAAKDEPQKLEPVMDDKEKSETAKEGDGKSEEAKPSVEGKSEAARVEMPKEGNGSETPVLQTNPVPSVTPAPPVTSTLPPMPTTAGAHEPAAAQTLSSPLSEKPAAVTASEPPPPPSPPVAATGQPAPPISR
jgi:hypothetical protein